MDAQVTHPRAQVVVRGTVERGNPFTDVTKTYNIGGLHVVVKVDSDLDRYFASREGKKVVIDIEAGE